MPGFLLRSGDVLEDRYRVAETGCWLWLGKCDLDGYPHLDNRKAATVFYEAKNGPVPDGLELDHLCRIRCCVNPIHLEAVTHLENVRRSSVRKVTDEQEYFIVKTNIDAVILAERYGIDRSTVYHIRRKAGRRSWLRLTDQQKSEIMNSSERGVDLASRFNITPGRVSQIRKGL
jgi:hypothetical protein